MNFAYKNVKYFFSFLLFFQYQFAKHFYDKLNEKFPNVYFQYDAPPPFLLDVVYLKTISKLEKDLNVKLEIDYTSSCLR
jgi:hypothetical protein